jgi:hypothetical protein
MLTLFTHESVGRRVAYRGRPRPAGQGARRCAAGPGPCLPAGEVEMIIRWFTGQVR